MSTGGIGSSIGEAIGQAAGKAATKLGGEAFGAEAASMWKRTFRSEDNFFFGKQASDEARFAGQLIKQSRETQDKLIPQLQQVPGAAPPGGARGAKQQLQGYSKDMAHEATFGKDYKVLGTLYAISHVKNGPAHTQNLMDHVALALKEDEDVAAKSFIHPKTGERQYEPGQEQISRSKEAGFKAIAALPQFKGSEEYLPREYSSIRSPYERPGPVEQWTTNFIYSRLSPLIAIPHLGTALNIVLSTKTSSWLPAFIDHMTNSTPQQIRDTMLHGGVLTESILRDLENRAQAENGVLTRDLPGSYQNVAAKISSTPFFPRVRDFQANWAGAASYHDAIDHAKMLGRDNFDKTAIARLEIYGMKPNDISMIKQTGQLTQDQLERAVYNGANHMIFFDTGFARTFNSQRNGYWRATHLYHGYVSQQFKFMAKEWKMQVYNDTRTLGSLAKFGVVAGAAFPVFGEGIKILEMAARGQFRQIGHELKEDEHSMTMRRGNSEAEKLYHFMTTYIDAYAHLGGLGIGYGIIQGAQRGLLANEAEGAIFGTATKYMQDTINMAKARTPQSAKPFLRDTISYATPWGLGRFASHAFLPTKKEEKESHPDYSMHRLGRRKRGTGLHSLRQMQ